MRVSLSAVVFMTALAISSQVAAQTNFVNEYIGTANEGQTFPATGVPFGMTQWTPETRSGNVKCVSPYYFSDTRISGFRGSHFLSGSCTQDYGSMTMMPVSGQLKVGATARSSAFDRKTEVATPSWYTVSLADYGVDAQITGTTRSGFLKFRFNKPGKSWLVFQMNSAPGQGSIQIDALKDEITVTNPANRLYAGNGKPAGFSGYFVVQFDHNIHLAGTWTGETPHPDKKVQANSTEPSGVFVSFDLAAGESVQAKVGTSFTSLSEARRNLQSEIPSWDFNEVQRQAEDHWNKALNRIQIQADSTHKRIFYTAMYHSMLLPRVFSDVSGTYPGFAGGGEVESAKDFTYYCDFSLWDTFRALHPLLTILDPDRERDMVKSLIAKGEQGGFLPIFPAWNSYTSEMVGDHADSVIADAYAKGIRGFDIQEAYQLMRKNATESPAHALYVDGRGRRALDSYVHYGYIPLEDPVQDAFHTAEQVSRTLEYAYDDSLIGGLAATLGKAADAELFHERGQNYRNVIDPQTGFARGRHVDGSWVSPFDPDAKASFITEGLPYQYTFFVPQDVAGLIGLLGGPSAFIAKLDGLFASNYYDHGNEPSHHIAYLYDNAGAAWKTQQHVRTVLDALYADTPSGLPGNDDCGQMSAWYVMSALGFYSVSPGTPIYQIGTPLFDAAVVDLPSGKHFRIIADGASSGKQYIVSATLNGVPLNRYWITHSEIVSGGELIFKMASHPNPNWPQVN
jgi:predicted alpha-1,2-mannosidase